MHPYIAPAISLLRSVFPIDMCLSHGYPSKPSSIPLGSQLNATQFTWLTAQSVSKVLEPFAIKTNLSTLYYKYMPGIFSHVYE